MTLELQSVILKMIARGEVLQATLERLCLEEEALGPDGVCSVLSVDKGHLHPLAGLSLPHPYSAALHNLAIVCHLDACRTGPDAKVQSFLKALMWPRLSSGAIIIACLSASDERLGVPQMGYAAPLILPTFLTNVRVDRSGYDGSRRCLASSSVLTQVCICVSTRAEVL